MTQQEKNLPVDTSAGPGGADPVVDDVADTQSASARHRIDHHPGRARRGA